MAEIDEVLQQVLADQREMEADPTPQTPAYALLAAGRLEEAEAVARQAVADLEKGDVEVGNNVAVVEPESVVPKSERAAQEEKNSTAENDTQLSLLAEALIAHGITLARLKKLEAAQATLERAIAVAQEAGAPDKAGLAALTMIEELEHLSRETLLSAYELASTNMAQMKNRKLQWRVIDAAKTVLARFWGEMDPDRALEILLARPRSLAEQVLSYEANLIKQALVQTNGNMADAASLLTLTPESLALMLEQRHKDLLASAARGDSQTGRAEGQHFPSTLHAQHRRSVWLTKSFLLTAMLTRTMPRAWPTIRFSSCCWIAHRLLVPSFLHSLL